MTHFQNKWFPSLHKQVVFVAHFQYDLPSNTSSVNVAATAFNEEYQRGKILAFPEFPRVSSYLFMYIFIFIFFLNLPKTNR